MHSWLAVLSWICLSVGTVSAQDKPADDAQVLEGTWAVLYAKMGDKEVPAEVLKKLTVRFQGNTVTIGEAKATYTLDTRQKPKHIDMRSADGLFRGIYHLDGKKLTLCWYKRDEQVPRPTDFSRENSKYELVFLELKKQ